MRSKLKKKIKKGKTLLPTRCAFFLADDIRIEQGGKTSLLGFYPDNIIVVPLPKEAKDPTKKERFGLAGIAILANFSDAFGAYEMELVLLGPRGEALAKSSGGKLIAEKKGSLNFVPRFSPMPVVGFGKYKLVLTLNKKAYPFTFEVRRGQSDLLNRGQAFYSPNKSPWTKE